MNDITTYRLFEQSNHKKMKRSYDRLIEEYRSQQPPNHASASKEELGLKECLRKMKRRVESSGRLQSEIEFKVSKDSARVMAFAEAINLSVNNTSGLSIKKSGKKPMSGQQQLSARQTNPPLSAKQAKTKKQTYQELLQRLESKSKDSHKQELKMDATKPKHKVQEVYTSKTKPQQPLKREPFSNVSVSKILDKYNQLKVRSGKRDDRCRT